MKKQVIETSKAPGAIGTYSQAVRFGHTVYLSGQIPLVPQSMELAGPEFATQAHQVFSNLGAVAKAAGGSLDDIAKLTIFLTDLSHFPSVNQIMAEYFEPPYPARAAVGVAALPKQALIEIDAVMVMGGERIE